MKARFFAKPADLRKWLEKNYDTVPELLVGFYKKGSGKPSITWPQSVDEALCFGWIDGVRRRIDEGGRRSGLRVLCGKTSSCVFTAENARTPTIA